MTAKCRYCNIVELDFEKLEDGSWKRTEKGTGTLHTPDRCKELKADPSLLSKLIAPTTTSSYIGTAPPIITESESTAGPTTQGINVKDLHDIVLQLTLIRNEVEADRIRIAQIVSNLLNNADNKDGQATVSVKDRIKKIEDDIIIIKESLEVLMRAQMGQPIEPKALDKVTS